MMPILGKNMWNFFWFVPKLALFFYEYSPYFEGDDHRTSKGGNHVKHDHRAKHHLPDANHTSKGDSQQ